MDTIIKNNRKARITINEKEIASIFYANPIPAREAIKRLSAEGFLRKLLADLA